MKKSFRAELIDAILNNAQKYPNMVVLNADSARALKLTEFSTAFPDRMFGVGISEADLAVSYTHLFPDMIISRVFSLNS